MRNLAFIRILCQHDITNKIILKDNTLSKVISELPNELQSTNSERINLQLLINFCSLEINRIKINRIQKEDDEFMTVLKYYLSNRDAQNDKALEYMIMAKNNMRDG
jgi:hypothetical protein